MIIDLRSFYNYAKNWQINTKFLLITKLFLSMTLFLFVLIYNSVKGIARGGWSRFGMVSNESDPTSFGLYPTGIPPRVIVQICRDGGWQVASVNLMYIRGRYHSPASKRCRQGMFPARTYFGWIFYGKGVCECFDLFKCQELILHVLLCFFMAVLSM